MGLKLVADAAYPFNLADLPAGVAAVAGYVGGDTPHIWTATEVAAVTKSGRQWWAIWTAPSTGQKLTAAQGSADGAGMVTALKARKYPAGQPVFYDIEQGTYAASPTGAKAAIAAWKAKLHAAGYTRAYAYLPWSAQADWVANWTYTAPASLPAGVVGWQWTSDQHLGKPFDLSSFTDTLFGDDMPLTPADANTLWAHPIAIPAATRKKFGYSEPSYPASSLLEDASWRARENKQEIDALAKANAALAKQVTALAAVVAKIAPGKTGAIAGKVSGTISITP